MTREHEPQRGDDPGRTGSGDDPDLRSGRGSSDAVPEFRAPPAVPRSDPVAPDGAQDGGAPPDRGGSGHAEGRDHTGSRSRRRRRGRRSSARRRSVHPSLPSQPTDGPTDSSAGSSSHSGGTRKSAPAGTTSAGPSGSQSTTRGGSRPRRRLRQVNEFSAGGLILDLTGEIPHGALIGRTDRQGRLLWSLPKGHIEAGESAEQAAVREVEEETGIAGIIVAELGTIDFWFVAEGRRIHKTVRHYLMRRTGGELSDADIEVDEVAWVPLPDIRAQLAYPDERGLVDTAGRLLADTA